MQDFPRIPLAVLSTPIQKLENISRLLNTNVYIKRDDLTGIGPGGNKVRKLEFLLADAKSKGAEVVFTHRRRTVQPRHADGGLFAIDIELD